MDPWEQEPSAQSSIRGGAARRPLQSEWICFLTLELETLEQDGGDRPQTRCTSCFILGMSEAGRRGRGKKYGTRVNCDALFPLFCFCQLFNIPCMIQIVKVKTRL